MIPQRQELANPQPTSSLDVSATLFLAARLSGSPRAGRRIIVIAGSGALGGMGTATAETHSEHAGYGRGRTILGRRAFARVRGALGRRLETGHRAPLNFSRPFKASGGLLLLRVHACKQPRSSLSNRLCGTSSGFALASHEHQRTTRGHAACAEKVSIRSVK